MKVDGVSSLEIVKLYPSEHKEARRVIRDASAIADLLDRLRLDDEKELLLEDLISPRYFLTGRNGTHAFSAQVLRRFINVGEGWQYIEDETFLPELERTLGDARPVEIVKDKEGTFAFGK